MLSRIAQRLKKISDEVDELHPLLKEVFSRQDGIDSIEYTHGANEMGADFVLSHTHEILKTPEWIGVIAKIGKIHQDLADIERQIEECSVPRMVKGGKDEIVISEVWVVTTDTITQGARRKINSRHQGTKVHFIDGQSLATMVQRTVPDYWADLPLPVATYLSEIRAEARERDYQLDLVQAESGPLYIDQDVVRVTIDPYRRGSHTHTRKSRPKPVDVAAEVIANSSVLVEAPMGGGKSKLLRRLVQTFATPEEYSEHGLLPIYVTFRSLVDDFSCNLDDLISKSVPEATRAAAAGEHASFLIAVDALDEKDLEPAQLGDELSELVQRASERGDVKMVFTSRFIGDLDFDHRFRNHLTRYEIMPLNVGRILQFLETVCAGIDISGRLIEDLRRSPLFDQLPRTPIAIVLLGQLLRENRQELPSTITELYQKYMELVLGRWDMQKGLVSQQQFETLENVLSELAVYMLDNGLDTVATDEVRQRARNYLRQRNLKVSEEDLLDRAVERAEILGQSRDGYTVWFKHRSFAEFLYAKHLVRHGVDASLRAFELYWTNVYFFAVGLLRDAPELLEELIGLVPQEEQHRWLKAANLGSFLMAAYQTPYHIVEEGVYTAMLEAAELFKGIVDGRIKSAFGVLPRMQLLYFMQLVMRDNYGYEFLARALEDSALRLDELHSDPRAPYALFLASVAYIDSGAEASFDFLLEEFSGQIPIDISLAVYHEGDKLEARNKALKKLRRKVERIMSGTGPVAAQVSELYEQPVALLVAATGDETGSNGQAGHGGH